MTVQQGKNGLLRPLAEEGFHFRCHKGISCFTKCCARLRLVLTPYDIVRMKRRLGISSDEFLEQYTDVVADQSIRFPMVKLKMSSGENQGCPFVSVQGCTIYEDRPGACRLYPLGRASTFVDGHDLAREKYFVVNEEHCLGFREGREWSLNEWLVHEGVLEYQVMNDQWLQVVTSRRSLGERSTVSRKLQMFFMASYNLDRFREFLFGSRFFHMFKVPSDLKETLASDDVELMKFAVEWLKFSLFGERTLKPRSDHLPPSHISTS